MNTNFSNEGPMTICRGSIVRAAYRKPEITDHAGNPLEEALPPMLTTDQLILRLQHFPEFSESMRTAADEVRYLAIQNSMRFFVPLDIHIDLYRRFTNVIRIGYAGRNPFPHAVRSRPPKLESFDQYKAQYKSGTPQFMSTAAGFNIAGISGVGKSFSLERILKLFPQVINHSNYEGKPFTQSQIVWMKLDCPFDGNPRGLCISFFKTVDALLGTNYRRDYGKGRAIQAELLSDMATVAGNHYIGVLVIDEIQRLSLARSGGADLLLNFFVQLVNDVGVPVVLVGTYKALAVLSGEFSQLRRGTGQGDLIWDRMPKGDQWDLFVKALFRAQYTRKRFNPTDLENVNANNGTMLGDVLYEESQGITDLAVKLYMFAQERAIDTANQTVTANVIRSVAKDKFIMLRDVLAALRSNNKKALANWDDVYPHALKAYLESFSKTGPSAVTIEGTVAAAPDIQITSRSENAPAPCEVAAEANPRSSVVPKCRNARRLSRKSRKAARQREPVLPPIVATALAAKTSPYEALKKNGYIKPAAEFLA
jgi:hypothetical protein